MRPVHPSIARTLMEGLRKDVSSRGSSRDHLNATMQWLCTAHDHGGGHGVSAAYSLAAGWEAPYPETTGYIIPTFYDYAALTGREEFRDRAKRMADWEISVQLESGAVRAGYLQNMSHCAPAVFNTGQVILGYCRACIETGDERYASAARAAGDWLLSVQNADGAWRVESPVVTTYVHAYDVRTAWSLLELHALTGVEKYFEAALRNVEWTLSQQHDDGWFANNAFERDANPYTHNVAYVMEGLLETWTLTRDERCWAAMFKTASRLLRTFETRTFMPGEFAEGWKTNASYSCLTGDAQIAGVWLRVFEARGDVRFLNAALKLNDYVKACQSLHSTHPAVRGGVKGSQPFGGGYTPFTYINWGAKFLADSLMLEERVFHQFEDAFLPERRGAAVGVADSAAPSEADGAQADQAEPARQP
jgi:hypothetical protein